MMLKELLQIIPSYTYFDLFEEESEDIWVLVKDNTCRKEIRNDFKNYLNYDVLELNQPDGEERISIVITV